MKKAFIKRKILIIVCILGIGSVIGYFCYVNANKMKTEMVLTGELEDFIETDAFIFRDEVLIKNDGNNLGILNYVLKDGEKVESGRTVAEIYENEDIKIKKLEIQKIEEELSILEKLNNLQSTISGRPDYISKTILDLIYVLKKDVINNDYSNLSERHKDILDALGKQKVMFNVPDDFSVRMLELKNRKDYLEKSINGANIKKIVSSSSGYFSLFSDGFENCLDISKVQKLKEKDIKDFLSAEIKNRNNKEAKIVKSPFWYMVCSVPLNLSSKVKVGSKVLVSFSSEDFKDIPAEVVLLGKNESDEGSFLVLKCNYVNKDVLCLRRENIRINFNTFCGLKFNKKALREKMVNKKVIAEDGKEIFVNKPVFGVYVLKFGFKVEPVFKEINLLYSNNEYVVCKNNESDDFKNADSLNQYDEIIVSGM